MSASLHIVVAGLNSLFRWANVTVGLPCVIENTGYIVYSGSNEYVDIVSRYVLALLFQVSP